LGGDTAAAEKHAVSARGPNAFLLDHHHPPFAMATLLEEKKKDKGKEREEPQVTAEQEQKEVAKTGLQPGHSPQLQGVDHFVASPSLPIEP